MRQRAFQRRLREALHHPPLLWLKAEEQEAFIERAHGAFEVEHLLAMDQDLLAKSELAAVERAERNPYRDT